MGETTANTHHTHSHQHLYIPIAGTPFRPDEELRRARDEASLSQEVVAHRAGVDRCYLSQFENTRKSSTLDLLFRVCVALGIKTSTWIERVERAREA